MNLTDILTTFKSFCSNDPNREYIQEPFSVDGCTVATDGHIMVVIDCALDSSNQHPRAPTLFAKQHISCAKKIIQTQQGYSLSDTLDNLNHRHKQPRKMRGHDSVIIFLQIINLNYLKKVSRLGDVTIYPTTKPRDPLVFKHPDGLGLIMPLTTK